ncbi:major intrinsic protein, partial [Gilbertella persicaria]|uniref:major intrinsic protein n=1 Tax=Gilbertella persicaria TaxID=101096 RepID=UPI002220FF69
GSSPNLKADLRASLGELVGMLIFIFLALSGAQTSLRAPLPNLVGDGLSLTQIESISYSFGIGIAVALFVCAHISGGVLNPAVLLSLVLTGNINWLRGIFFFVAEIVGAIIGAYFARFIAAQNFQGANVLNTSYNYAQGFFLECLLTCVLCLTVLFVIIDRRLLSDFAPLVVGVTVFVCHMIATPIDGTSINPARSFAASVVTGRWSDHWIFWFGPLVGGIFAVMVYVSIKFL